MRRGRIPHYIDTKAVCRKCYIHPAILESYLDGSMMAIINRRTRTVARAVERLTKGEAAALCVLERRLANGSRRKAASAA